MQLHRRQLLRLAASAAALSAGLPARPAQAFPAHPITMVVPVLSRRRAWTRIARIVAQGMSASLGQPVMIENVTGASGSIGVGRVARCGTRWLHAVYGAFVTHVVNARGADAALRRACRFRADRADLGNTPWLIAQERSAGERSATN